MTFDEGRDLLVDILTEYLPKTTKEDKTEVAETILTTLVEEGVLDIEDPPEDEPHTLDEIINGY